MNKNIGFVGGGQMAEAIIKGLIHSNTCSSETISVCEPLEARRNYLAATYNLEVSATAKKIINISQIIVLAVKPQVMPEVLKEIKPTLEGQMIITIAAGLPLSFYTGLLDNDRLPIVRVMPNTPALILQGASALCRNEHVTDSDFILAESLFKAIGITVVVSEKGMDAVTGLSGSGPAYVFTFIEALIDAGIKTGLSRDVARALTIQTILGTTLLARESTDHPAALRDRVTSPGGTTISGLHILEAAGFNGVIMSAVEAACRRSTELGKTS